MVEVFISYVREDSEYVEYLKSLLEANGVKVWLDKDRLMPGMRWKDAIRTAIRNGTFFLSIHSHNRSQRPFSYVNEELVLAIEELRKRRYDVKWLIPIKIDDSEMEERPIGAGETLLDLNYCDLTDWVPELRKLFAVLGVEDPALEFGEPLAPGLTSTVIIPNGVLSYDSLPGLPEMMQGIEFRVTAGWCQRLDDGSIIANIETSAPFPKYQEINQQHGLSSVLAHTQDKFISTDQNKPTVFTNVREYVMPMGMPTYNFETQSEVELPFDFPVRTAFIARGALNGMVFSGVFEAEIQSRLPDVPLKHFQHGHFSLEFRPVVRAAG